MSREAGVLIVTLCCALAAPARADKKAASEHFALAESAERRKDWRTAIDEYELAYAAEPHAAMLYNIARNYERLSEPRNAGEYYRRYLDQAPDARDREKIEGRLVALRDRRSKVDVVASPEGAAVFIDDERQGEAPLSLVLDPGLHEAYVAHQGKTSRVKTFTVEYGEAQTLRFDMVRRSGFLTIASNVEGAEVRFDGELIGRTPFRGPVPAGKHQLVITRPGYKTAQREIEISPSGSQQIRADLERADGAPAEQKPSAPPRYLFGITYGYDGVGEAPRYAFELGVRTGSEKLEAALVIGLLGPELTGAGLEGRYYFKAGGAFRPYLRTAGLVLKDNSAADEGRMIAVEGGIGALVPMQTRAYRLDYYVELNVQAIVAGLPEAPMDMPDADTLSRFTVPVSFGILWSWGRRSTAQR
jgi:tetratricopeptide (TPR) repeat protein